MSNIPEQPTNSDTGTGSGRPAPSQRTSRTQLAWGLVGWMNFIAMAIIGLIIAHVSGYTLTNMGAWIGGAVVLTLFVVVGTLWLMLRPE